MDSARQQHLNLSADNIFGPVVNNIHDDFDFTLFFEQTILSIGPSAALLLFLPVRIWWIWGEPKKADYNCLVAAKQTLYFLLIAVQIAILAFSITFLGPIKTAIPSTTLSLVAVLGLNGLSFIEHIRSPRTSDGINMYLFLSSIFDAVQVRSLHLRHIPTQLKGAAIACLVLKIVLLLAEMQGKGKYLYAKYQSLAPETLSGVFARRFFWWLNDMLREGYRTIIWTDQLQPIKEDFAAKGLVSNIQAHSMKDAGSKRRQIITSSFVALKGSIMAPIVPRLATAGFRYSQPFLFEAIISFLGQKASVRNPNHGYGLIAATALIYIGLTISLTYYQHKTYQLVTKLRGTLVSVLYAKTMASSSEGLKGCAPVTLMSVDVDGITSSAPVLHEVWASILEMGISIWLLQRQLGIVCVVPLAVESSVLVCNTVAIYCSGKMGSRQATWNKATQQRIAATAAALNAIKRIKMMGFTKYIASDISALRNQEIIRSKAFRRLNLALNFLANIPFYATPVITFAIFTALPRSQFTISKAFTSLSLITLLEQSSISFISSLPAIAAASGCFGRLCKFLEKEDPERHNDEATSSRIEAVFKISDASFGHSGEESLLLRGINLTIQRGTFVGLTGPAGCGKTTLLKVLLGAHSCSSGTCEVSAGPIAYCAQIPWIGNGTIRQAIIGHTVFDLKWYECVVKACSLEQDLVVLRDHDRTNVGSQGTTLSGGQKQRIALARAIYSRHAAIVLDDVFSGMDAETTKHISKSLFEMDGLLRTMGCTAILVTHSTSALQKMDKILTVGPEGTITYSDPCTPVEDKASSAYLAFERRPSDTIDIMGETKSPQYVTITPTKTSDTENKDAKRQSGDWGIYRHYILSVGWWLFTYLIGVHALCAALDYFPTIWLKQWSEAEQSRPGSMTSLYLGIYGAVSISGLVTVVVSIWLMFLVLVPVSGRNLHAKLLDTVVHAKQELHDTVDIGITLNRFAQDMQHIDRELPSATIRSLHATFGCLASAVLVCVGASYIAAIIPVLCAALYLLQKYYLRTSRQLRLLEIEARSPLYTIFEETVEGIDTIVSFKWQSPFQEKLFRLLDASQKPYYLLFCIQRWLMLVLGLMVAAMAMLLVALAIEVRQASSSSSVGVGLIAILTFNDLLNRLIVEWTSLETSLGAITRLKNFSQDTPVEADACDNNIPENWPARGTVEFRGACASYRPGLPPVLRNITFTIPAGTKFGICGRTGSGKSTLLNAIFRLLDLNDGQILIDGIPHNQIPLDTLRSQVVALPQQPYLLSGSIRRSMDPENSASDSDILDALGKVGLRDILVSSSDIEPLSAELEPDTLSPGQKQLFCLARAMIQDTKILVLDEATSSLDAGNDALVQKLIREEFSNKGCTIIAIAHRLASIADFDSVAVMRNGELMELGNPRDLLESQRSEFGRMWKEYEG
ncbi:P-loop containing nucleoside triphosphate hydrolase protein [Corynespora cassiicola Philippines]|uniref:P-loop containing nucleoside triphosphate hydrolase protein n=1 Tax=Corynespora cassiicola Philippines TaxID=1448308 RepID=A0A2T2NVQ6_CORCC|nr:P-loop containing nucleoside triphosphate hydrolase protein [Corynespora cassiicola Philippines]